MRGRVIGSFMLGFTVLAKPTNPLSIDALALFISYLSCKQFAVTTIHLYVSAIGYVHCLRGIGDPTKSFLIQKLLMATS